MALVADHTVARDTVAAAVPPLSAGERDRLIATALAASTVAPVVPITTARSTRWRQVAIGGLAAAAAAGLVALVLVRPSSDDQADGGAERGHGGDRGAGGGRDDRRHQQPAFLHARRGRGCGDDCGCRGRGRRYASVRRAPRQRPRPPHRRTSSAAPASPTSGWRTSARWPTGRRSSPPLAPFAAVTPAPEPAPCPGYPAPLATATFQGAPALVVVVAPAPEGNRLALVDAVTCAVLIEVDTAAA